MVMKSTFDSRGSDAMYTMARPTSSTSMVGSAIMLPFGCGIPAIIGFVISVAALPMSSWPHAMLKGRPSNAQLFVRPVIACLVDVYGAELGLGRSAEMEPLLMILPPCGDCAFIIRKACCVHRNGAVRLVFTTCIHCKYVNFSMGTAGAPQPALLKARRDGHAPAAEWQTGYPPLSGLVNLQGEQALMHHHMQQSPGPSPSTAPLFFL
eukprot:CAMPEP_0172887080 /NCGR_PEP_ID=MMETSP1075-20121228/132903_1 /TAXON_ID=2916 /ORGANISM="Ceratium fusus, Strain PA161109" /LENGTH=207 /DNA_ID=CAMNT_0013740683 /DNA_START=237 /DNA_END=861 /DNA_ORIENTATION=-